LAIDSYIPYLELTSKLDLKPGDWLMVSADISKIAFMAKRKEGSFEPQKFINQLFDAIQPGGTLIIPAFNYLLQDGDDFDILHTRPITGTLAIEALKMEGFKRTKHPLHSFMVKGDGLDLLCSLNNLSSFGHDSPFALMYQKHAKALLVNLGIHDSFTFTHYVEESAKVSYRYHKTFKINYTDEQSIQSVKRYSIYKKFPWIALNFHPLEQMLIPSEIQHSNINGVAFRLLDLRKAFQIIEVEIRENGARNIAHVNVKRGLKEILKDVLRKLGLYKTLTEKMHHVSGL
jgi:aminoglycoside 3-N-acetyltransferase